MKKTLFILVFIILVGSIYGSNILEYYNISGESEGSDYTGSLSFLEHGEIYEVNWSIEGMETYTGVGINIANYIAVSYSDYDFFNFGLVYYEIHDNYITGFWASPLEEYIHSGYEIGFIEDESIPWFDLTSYGADISGEYILEGKNYNGDTYEGFVTIEKEDDYYFIIQDAGTIIYGFAFTDKNNLVIAWTDEEYSTLGVGFMEIKSGTIEGKWAFYGDEESGWEKWTKE